MSQIESKDVSIVFQGPISNILTAKCLASAREIFPEAHIILSTWRGSDVAKLNFDTLILNDDPGTNTIIEGEKEYQSNCFRQIVSSYNGLKACKTKYALKIRTDICLTNANIIDYFETYNKKSFDENFKILKKRAVTLTTCNPHRRTKWTFNVSDWIFFGLTEDVLNIFDISTDKIDICNISAEQYIWTSFLNKYKSIKLDYTADISNNNIELSESYFANNLILLSAYRAGIKFLKQPGYAYSQFPALSNSGLYTFNEYKRLLNKYANNNIFIFPNIPEIILYFIVYQGRFIAKKIYQKICK